MKVFNTKGMKNLTQEDQDKWSSWDWTSAAYHEEEIADYNVADWWRVDRLHGSGGGGGGGGGCCVLQ